MNPRPKRNFRSLTVAVFGFALLILWIVLPDPRSFFATKHQKLIFSDAELIESLPSFAAPEKPAFDLKMQRAAALGRRLFFDVRFSEQGQLSCATCHQPGLDFTDGRPLAIGQGPLDRHTPSLLNSFAASWFFWDGRADSLAAQVQGPVEAPLEHGVDRGRVAQILWQNYKDIYSSVFGPWPPSLGPWLESSQNFRARKGREALALSLPLAHYALATIASTRLQTQWIQGAASADMSPQKFLATRYLKADDPDNPAVLTYRALTPQQQADLDQVFANFSWALAQYERGLVALRSPFDAFIERSRRAGEAKLGEDFGPDAWRGYRVFMESGCANCHRGPLFSNQQFHNIGLSQGEGPLDLGRAAGLLQVKADAFNCLYDRYPESTRRAAESCAELEFLNTESQEAVGAFKTPSLRNVANTAPYMHDGRFASLSQVLEHYNSLEGEPAVGHRDETLQALQLERTELDALEKFLRSLSSPVDDLTVGSPAKGE